MSNADNVFRLLEQMRNARPGQRIVQGRLDLSIEKPDDGEASPGEGREPEQANEDQDAGGETGSKADSRRIR